MQSSNIKYTVLLLSAPIGSGHKLAAEALQEELSQYKQINVIHGNIFDFFPHFLGQSFLRIYLWILRCCPWVYELAYKWGNKQGGSLWLRSLLNKILARLGNTYLQKIKPDVVIATHATPAGIMADYKKNHPNLYLSAVITDFTIHRWWICDGVDTYFIADEKLRTKLSVSAEVKAYGIPLRRQFVHNDKKMYRQKMCWKDNDHVCILMGGGEGLLPMDKIIANLLLLQKENLKIVAITGHNKQLYEKLSQKYVDKITIYGFRNDVPQMMAAADIIITKAGGLTSAEVLASNLKFLIYNPLPGQEEGNAEFLQKYCGAVIARNLKELTDYVKKEDAGNLFYSKQENHAHPLAAKNICEYIMKKLDNR